MKSLLFKLFIFFVFLISNSQYILSQSTAKGFKLFENYSPQEYDNAMQNWCILQDKHGIIYVANQGGLLEFDGVSWRSIDIPHGSARSIALSKDDTIYIGGEEEIGYLTPDMRGVLHYHSLMSHINNASHRKFGTVWKTHATKDCIYFDTSNFLFQWDTIKRNLKVIEADHFLLWYKTLQRMFSYVSIPKLPYFGSFTIDGRLYVQKRRMPLTQMIDNCLQVIPDGETFRGKYIYFLVPLDSKKLLIGTRNSGLYKYDGKKAVPFVTAADSIWKEKRLHYGIRLSSGDFALATHEGGLVIINPQGKIMQVFDKSWGLPDNDVKYVFEDRQGNLWLALERGITKIEYSSPISFFDERSSLSGVVKSVKRNQGNLYVGTNKGLFYLQENGKFKMVPGIQSHSWALLPVDESLLVATTHGIFQVQRNQNDFTNRLAAEFSSYSLHQSNYIRNRIFAGTKYGLIALYRNHKGQWNIEHLFDDLSESFLSIGEDTKGNLWMGHRGAGVIKVSFQDGKSIDNPKVTEYNIKHGLPQMIVRVASINNRLIFATDNGLFRFDGSTQKFVPDASFGERFSGGENSNSVFRIAEDNDRNIWLHSDNQNYSAVLQEDGSYIIKEKSLLRIPKVIINDIFPNPNGNIIWFGGMDGLIRFNRKIGQISDHIKVSIRKVLVNGEMIYGGVESHQPFPILDYDNRNLRFEVAAPFFEGEKDIRFRYLLEGYDRDWSGWTEEPQKEYTNLDSGEYIFHVQAENVHGSLSNIATFTSIILPPWYRTWWAYLLYTIMAVVGVYFLVRWRLGKLEREKKKLEGIIKESTMEIQEKNIQLEEQSEKLKELDKAKSRFFANISHEFRTPLTLLLGPLEQMIESCGNNEVEKKQKLTLMMHNAQRLLRLINQLLELSRLDSGKLKLQAVESDIVSFVRGLTDSFRIMARQKELELILNVDTGYEEFRLHYDRRKMEAVISNLLINAFNFTPAGGKISVSITVDLSPGKNFPEGLVEISVRDTGHGIPKEQLTRIFDRFYQADNTFEHNQKGSGIGLALSKEFVELHHGIISAKSRSDHGTTFTVRLPMGKAHLAEDEILDSSRAHTLEDRIIPTDPLEIGIEDENGDTAKEIELSSTPEEANIILVVEDSADMRDYIKGALIPGYTIVEAINGKEGIEKAQAIIPDLIISDIMMPEMDGYELCRTLKGDIRTSHIPIILLTAKASEESIVEGLETGADDYITKPFSTIILCARIKNLIDVRSQLQANINRELTLRPVKTTVSKLDSDFLRDLQAVIKDNLSEPEFNVEELCKKLYMSNTTLYRKIQALCGQTPTEFIRSCRLKRALQLLQSGFGSVTEVAFEVGFSSRAYFTKCFKEKFHQLPSNFYESQ